MKLTDLLKLLLHWSDFENPNTLANYTSQTQPLVSAFIYGTKKTREKEDAIFDALTNDISAEELLSAIELIKTVRQGIIERDQFLWFMPDVS